VLVIAGGSATLVAALAATGSMFGKASAASAVAAASVRGGGASVVSADPTARIRVWRIRYRSHDGFATNAYVALPADYGPSHHPSIPLVISPHGRNVEGRANLVRWGSLPAAGPFAVISPDGRGRVLSLYSWGYAGQIDDLARMPEILRQELPWLTIDHRRIYSIGASMGGQEGLLLIAGFPHLLAGVAALDSVTDFALQYENFPRLGASLGKKLQRLARIEVGGTPKTAPAAYARRSPITYAREIAFSGVPLEIWWSVKDVVVVDQSRQSGDFFARLKRLNPSASVQEYVGSWTHGKDMHATTGLPRILVTFGLLPSDYPVPPFPARKKS
jgi:poly(3-hydroxybutyrate) depolymerase